MPFSVLAVIGLITGSNNNNKVQEFAFLIRMHSYEWHSSACVVTLYDQIALWHGQAFNLIYWDVMFGTE